jgi:hypothetical protein
MRLGVVGDSRYDMPVRLHNNVCGCCRDPFHSCIHRSSGWVNHCYIHTNINRSAHLVSSAANASTSIGKPNCKTQPCRLPSWAWSGNYFTRYVRIHDVRKMLIMNEVLLWVLWLSVGADATSVKSRLVFIGDELFLRQRSTIPDAGMLVCHLRVE